MANEENIIPAPANSQELEREQETIELMPIRELIEQCELDPEKDYGEPKYVFTQNGVGFGPVGDIQMIKAPQKNGKTFLFALMMGAMMNGEYLGLKCMIDDPTILYIDTEQHPRNTQLVYRRACKIAGRNGRERNAKFRAFHFRGKSPEDITSATMLLIEEMRPTVVFLDGVRDLVNDFNNQDESARMVRLLMDKALEYECSIWSIIHVNPGSDKARGHLGTEMQNKVSDVLCCLKEKKPEGVVFTVNQSDARNRDIQDFSFIIQDVQDNQGNWIAIPTATHISVKAKTSADEVMSKALHEGPLRYSDLADKIVDISEVSLPTAKRRIKDAIDGGIIYIDPVMNKYHYRGLDLDNDEDKPF